MSNELVEAGNEMISLLRMYFRPSGMPGEVPSFLFEVDIETKEEREQNVNIDEIGRFRNLQSKKRYVVEAVNEIRPLEKVKESLIRVSGALDKDSAPRFSYLFERLNEMAWYQGQCWSESSSLIDKNEKKIARFGFHFSEIEDQFLWDMKTALDEVGPSAYSRPRSPSEWEKIFDLSWRTIKRRIDSGKIRAKKISTKSYRIHVNDVPGQ